MNCPTGGVRLGSTDTTNEATKVPVAFQSFLLGRTGDWTRC